MWVTLRDRLYTRIPRGVRVYPLGMMAMWWWGLAGVSLLIPASNSNDPTPWPELAWPGVSVDQSEQVAMVILGFAMVVSSTMFLIAHMSAERYGCQWAWALRWQSLWLAGVVPVYVLAGIAVKVTTAPGEVTPLWPVSVVLWLSTLAGFYLAARLSLALSREVLWTSPRK